MPTDPAPRPPSDVETIQELLGEVRRADGKIGLLLRERDLQVKRLRTMRDAAAVRGVQVNPSLAAEVEDVLAGTSRAVLKAKPTFASEALAFLRSCHPNAVHADLVKAHVEGVLKTRFQPTTSKTTLNRLVARRQAERNGELYKLRHDSTEAPVPRVERRRLASLGIDPGGPRPGKATTADVRRQIRDILSRTGPLPGQQLRRLLGAAFEVLPGKDPQENFYTIVAKAPDFVSLGEHGYWLRHLPWPAAGYEPT